jgi:hypothetical protein
MFANRLLQVGCAVGLLAWACGTTGRDKPPASGDMAGSAGSITNASGSGAVNNMGGAGAVSGVGADAAASGIDGAGDAGSSGSGGASTGESGGVGAVSGLAGRSNSAGGGNNSGAGAGGSAPMSTGGECSMANSTCPSGLECHCCQSPGRQDACVCTTACFTNAQCSGKSCMYNFCVESTFCGSG